MTTAQPTRKYSERKKTHTIMGADLECYGLVLAMDLGFRVYNTPHVECLQRDSDLQANPPGDFQMKIYR